MDDIDTEYGFIETESDKIEEMMISYGLHKLYYGDLSMKEYWNDAFYDDLYDFCNNIVTYYSRVRDNKKATYENMREILNLRFDNILERDEKLRDKVKKFCNKATRYYLNYEKEQMFDDIYPKTYLNH